MTEQERRVLEFAIASRGSRVGNGECWTLAERALESAGAVTSSELQNVGRTLNYVWGDAIGISAAEPGDIIQFRDGFTVTKTVTQPDGAYRTETFRIRRHHTAIVEQVITRGRAYRIIGQNMPPRSAVVSQDFYFASTDFEEGGNSVSVVVSGQADFYRPQARTTPRSSRR